MDIETFMEDGVGRIELNRPEQMNALTVELVRGIGEAGTRLVADGARAIVLAGRGRTFCAGADLGLVRGALEGSPEEVLTPLVDELHGTIRTLRALPVPIVAAIEGPAVGAGLGLALTADLRVAGADARLIPGYMGIGSSPDGGVSYFLARMLGPARATRVLLLNEPLDPAQALELGLVDEVVENGGAIAAATALAKRLGSAPPLALLRVRELVDASTSQDLSEHLDHEQRLVTELWETHDFREGVSSFLERRKPEFTGK